MDTHRNIEREKESEKEPQSKAYTHTHTAGKKRILKIESVWCVVHLSVLLS